MLVEQVREPRALRFDIAASSLPEPIKTRLLAMKDQRITKDGTVVIKAQQHRSQDMNRDEALRRLAELVESAAHVPTVRRPTRPSKAAKKRRLESKIKRGEIKAMRSKITD